MKTSLFEIFKIGIGPSSSHTVGPMRAAAAFVEKLRDSGMMQRTARVEANLRLDSLWSDLVRQLAAQPQQHRPVCTVSVPGQRQRTVGGTPFSSGVRFSASTDGGGIRLLPLTGEW